MEPIADEVVVVPVPDLHIIRAALNSAYHQNTVLDLAEQYRKLHQRPQPSKLTTALHNALTLTVAYIESLDVAGDDQAEENESDHA